MAPLGLDADARQTPSKQASPVGAFQLVSVGLQRFVIHASDAELQRVEQKWHLSYVFWGELSVSGIPPENACPLPISMPTTNLTIDLPMATKTEAPATFPHSTTTLNQAIIKATLISVVIVMAIYTAIEFMLVRPTHIGEFLGHHLLHAVVIGLVLSVVLAVLLSRFIVAPVRLIFQHLYYVGSGRLTPLEVDSKIEEVNTVVGGINLLVDRLKAAPEDHALSLAVEDVGKLRADLKAKIEAAGDDADDFANIMRDLCALEQHLLSVVGAAGQLA